MFSSPGRGLCRFAVTYQFLFLLFLDKPYRDNSRILFFPTSSHWQGHQTGKKDQAYHSFHKIPSWKSFGFSFTFPVIFLIDKTSVIALFSCLLHELCQGFPEAAAPVISHPVFPESAQTTAGSTEDNTRSSHISVCRFSLHPWFTPSFWSFWKQRNLHRCNPKAPRSSLTRFPWNHLFPSVCRGFPCSVQVPWQARSSFFSVPSINV